MKRSPFFTMLSIVLLVMLGGRFVAPALASGDDYYQKLKISWVNMQKVFETLNSHYMEEIDPYELVKAGINGMLEELDPYTVFIEEEGNRRLQIITTGKYGGLGMEIGMRNKQITVITPMDHSPAQRAGIMAGDIVLKVDGADVDGWNINQVSKKLRGAIGGTVQLTIQRPGLEEPFTVSLTREEIVIEDVTYYGYIAPGIGYISLGGFTEKAPAEVRNALLEMQKQGHLEKLILDLRGNPGGLLDAAVKIVNLFVPAGEVVVSTRGFREEEVVFKTTDQPLLPDTPLVVLVDGGSASASEIVTGALQDLDRAVIIGQPTFGKGLVQKVYNIDKNSHTKLKITTAKYYIPSGRSIQKRDYARDKKVLHIAEADSLLHNDNHNVYYTRNKRKVLDKGGIHPDVIVEGDSLDSYMVDLFRQHTFFNFAVDYHSRHATWNRQVSDTLITAFQTFVDEQGLEYSEPGAPALKKLSRLSDKMNNEKARVLIRELKNVLRVDPKKRFEKNKAIIQRYLMQELAEKYEGRKGRVAIAALNDPVIETAKTYLNKDSYKKILAIK
ncbi:MAG: S41 family peptidase [Calditrichaeota bacterium]|nr:MAG: S41 family peptidase [Calditrichota bacterium]